MTLVLTEKAEQMLADCPPYLRNDPGFQRIIYAEAMELERIEDAAVAIRQAMFPSQANDVPILGGVWTAKLLSMWETMLRLPVAPAGVALADRQAKVLAHIRKRQSGSELDWVDTINAALSGFAWAYEEGPSDYAVTILIPYGSGSYNAGQLLALAQEITPAHIQVGVTYAQGWLADVSDTDIDAVF